MNRIDRLMGIIIYLQGRRVSRAEDIAAHFEISLRTVYRDISALGEAGVPIVSEAGVGYGLLKGFHLPPVMFSPEEAGALATAGVLVEQMTDPSIKSVMSQALLKIRAVLPRDQQHRLASIERGTVFHVSHSEFNREQPAYLLQIQEALAGCRVLRISYRSASSGPQGATLTRDVEPVGLVHYLQYWHLIAWCRLRSDFRDFRLDRIQSLVIRPEVFQPREGMVLEDHIRRLQHHDRGVTIRVRFPSRLVDRARREWSLGWVAEEKVEDGVIITLRGGELDWFVGWLLSYGPSVTVQDPPELRRLLVEAAEAAARHHGSGPEKVS